MLEYKHKLLSHTSMERHVSVHGHLIPTFLSHKNLITVYSTSNQIMFLKWVVVWEQWTMPSSDLPFNTSLSLIEIITLSHSIEIITSWIKQTKLRLVPWFVSINPQNLSAGEDFYEWEEYEDMYMIQPMGHQMYEQGIKW